MAVDLRVEPALRAGRAAPRGVCADKPVERARGAQRRLKQRAAGREPGEDMTLPGDGEAAAILDRQRERLVGRIDERGRAAVELFAEAALGGGEEQALVGQPGGRIDPEFEAGEVADRLRADADLAVGGDGHRQGVGAARADVADEHGGAAVDEALGQPLVQRVAQPRFDLAGALGPFGGLGQPVGAVRDIGPAADPGEAVGQRLDVAARHCRAGRPRRRTIRAGHGRLRRCS